MKVYRIVIVIIGCAIVFGCGERPVVDADISNEVQLESQSDDIEASKSTGIEASESLRQEVSAALTAIKYQAGKDTTQTIYLMRQIATDITAMDMEILPAHKEWATSISRELIRISDDAELTSNSGNINQTIVRFEGALQPFL